MQIYLILNVIFLKGYSIEYPGFLSGTSQLQKGGVMKNKVIYVVRMVGLEPTRLSALDPKSSSATSYDTSACPSLRGGRLPPNCF